MNIFVSVITRTKPAWITIFSSKNHHTRHKIKFASWWPCSVAQAQALAMLLLKNKVRVRTPVFVTMIGVTEALETTLEKPAFKL